MKIMSVCAASSSCVRRALCHERIMPIHRYGLPGPPGFPPPGPPGFPPPMPPPILPDSEPSFVVTSPPLFVKLPLASIAVLPLPPQVRRSVPPLTMISPLESMQSPSDTIVSEPLSIMTKLSVLALNGSRLSSSSSAAFMPSSEEMISLLPLLMVHPQ